MKSPDPLRMHLKAHLTATAVLGLLGIGQLSGSEDFTAVITPFIDQHCVKCHGEKKQKGDMRLDTLSHDFNDPKISITWQDVVDMLKLGDMPPEEEERPALPEITRVIESIEASIRRSIDPHRSQDRMAIRRLSHSALDHVALDLLNIPIPLSTGLPADLEVGGFENLAETMNASQEFMNKLQENARRLAGQAIVEGPDLRTNHVFSVSAIDHGARVLPIGENLATWSSKNKFNCLWPGQFVAPASGLYRLRVLAFARDNRYQLDRQGLAYELIANQNPGQNQTEDRISEKAPRLVAVKANEASQVRSEGGEATHGHQTGLIQVGDQLAWHETEVILEKGENLFLHYITSPRLQNAPLAMVNGEETLVGEALFVREMQLEGPLLDDWPTRIQQGLLGRGETDDNGLSERLNGFLKRAFRAPVPQTTVDRYASLYRMGLAQGLSREVSMRNVLVGVLCSPRFLYNYERHGQDRAWTLANRLSLFLWNSMPDDRLFALAESGDILKTGVLKAEARRLLADPKSRRFAIDFTAQWLGLKKVGAMLPDPKLYPDYDPALEIAMRKESELFFEEILRQNLPIETFIDSDFSVLNERLAQHYGIEDVRGQAFRKVKLPADSPRGGVLTHASILTITSNGTRTSPVVRGVWMLENILDSPPSPPPPDVEPIEPDIRGAKTIREMLEKHRGVETCNDCHHRIDPWGFGMENFNAVGVWRDHYFNDKPVDSTGTLADGTPFSGLEELKHILLDRSDRFSHALTMKLLTHALGHHPTLSERFAIDKIVADTREAGNGLADLIVNICASPAFTGRSPGLVSTH